MQVRAEAVDFSPGANCRGVLCRIRVFRPSVDDVEVAVLATFLQGEENSCPRRVDVEEQVGMVRRYTFRGCQSTLTAEEQRERTY